MKPEELLKPRYKVIAGYPDSPYKLGDIKMYDKHKEFITLDQWDNYFSIYPHLFKKLGWWEERNREDIPKYVKDKNGNFYSTENWKINGRSVEIMDDDFNIGYVPVWEYEPATEEEFLTQQK